MTRFINRLLAFLIGIALAAGGALVIIEGVATGTGSGFVWIRGNEWLSSFKTTEWSDAMVVSISVAVAAAGALLTIFEVRPHPKRTTPISVDGPGTWALMRRSTEAHLTRRLSSDVPVPAKARLRPRRHRWSVRVSTKAARSARDALQQAAQSELEALKAPKHSSIRVKATGSRAEDSP